MIGYQKGQHFQKFTFKFECAVKLLKKILARIIKMQGC